VDPERGKRRNGMLGREAVDLCDELLLFTGLEDAGRAPQLVAASAGHDPAEQDVPPSNPPRDVLAAHGDDRVAQDLLELDRRPRPHRACAPRAETRLGQAAGRRPLGIAQPGKLAEALRRGAATGQLAIQVRVGAEQRDGLRRHCPVVAAEVVDRRLEMLGVIGDRPLLQPLPDAIGRSAAPALLPRTGETAELVLAPAATGARRVSSTLRHLPNARTACGRIGRLYFKYDSARGGEGTGRHSQGHP